MKLPAVLGMCVAAAMVGCGTEVPTRKPVVVAKVGEATLTVDELEMMVRTPDAGQVTGDIKRLALERWVDRELLYQAGVRDGIEQDPEVFRRIKWARKELVVHALLVNRFREGLEVTDDEVLQYYEDQKLQFARAQTDIHLHKIVVDSRITARNLYRRLRRGEDFAAVARKYSRDPSSEDGGDLGFMIRTDEWDPDLWARLQQAHDEQILAPVQTSQGHEIYQVLEKRLEGTPKALEDVRLEIINRIRANKQWGRKTELVEHLKIETDYWVDLGPLGLATWDDEADSVGSVE